MMLEIGRVTFRQLLGRRRLILLALAALLPAFVGLIYRLSSPIGFDASFASSVYDGLIVTVLLPLVALVVGTAAFGSEIEDGTAIYLLAKPVPRWRIVVAKLTVAVLISVLLAGGGTLVTGLVALAGTADTNGIIVGYTVGVAAGAIVYSALFVALSLSTSRALVFGLLYVLIWEGVLTGFFSGLRTFSVHQYVLGISDLAGVNGRVMSDTMAGGTAVGLAVLVTVLATAFAATRLSAFELPQAD